MAVDFPTRRQTKRQTREGHVASMGDRKDAYKILVRKSEERNHLKDPGVDGKLILKCIFEKRDVGAWT